MSAPLSSALAPVIDLRLLVLSDDEMRLVQAHRAELAARKYEYDLRNLYYNGQQVVRDLKISVPPELRGLHTVIGWPQIGVDAIEQRLDIDTWRFAKSTEDSDDDLIDLWAANDGEVESQLAHLDALIYRCSYGAVGAGDDPGDAPIITVESPTDMDVAWDARRRVVTSALRTYQVEGRDAVTLYLPDETIHAVAGADGTWTVTARDRHKLGEVPVKRIPNRQRTASRGGQSEITAAVMSITDAACRTLLGLEVAREFYGAPQRYILGAAESAFQDAEGNQKSAWQTYIGRVLALEADEDGNLPQVGQFAAHDPGTYTRIIDMYARIMATQLGLPPHYLGYTTDNPASADAIRSTEAQLVKRAERKQRVFGGAWSQIMRLALRFRDGEFPEQRPEPVWRNPATPTLAASTDAAVKLVGAGILPADSDVTMEMVGLTASQARRVTADRRRTGGLAALDRIVADAGAPGGVAAG